MHGGVEATIHERDYLPPRFMVFEAMGRQDKMGRIIEERRSKGQGQPMLRHVGRVFGRIKFDWHQRFMASLAEVPKGPSRPVTGLHCLFGSQDLWSPPSDAYVAASLCHAGAGQHDRGSLPRCGAGGPCPAVDAGFRQHDGAFGAKGCLNTNLCRGHPCPPQRTTLTPALAAMVQRYRPGVRHVRCGGDLRKGARAVGGTFEHRDQAWSSDEVAKLHALAIKGMPLRAIAKALTRSEEAVRARAEADRLRIASLR